MEPHRRNLAPFRRCPFLTHSIVPALRSMVVEASRAAFLGANPRCVVRSETTSSSHNSDARLRSDAGRAPTHIGRAAGCACPRYRDVTSDSTDALPRDGMELRSGAAPLSARCDGASDVRLQRWHHAPRLVAVLLAAAAAAVCAAAPDNVAAPASSPTSHQSGSSPGGVGGSGGVGVDAIALQPGMFLSSKTPYFPQQHWASYEPMPPHCELVHINHLGRHGSRHSTKLKAALHAYDALAEVRGGRGLCARDVLIWPYDAPAEGRERERESCVVVRRGDLRVVRRMLGGDDGVVCSTAYSIISNR